MNENDNRFKSIAGYRTRTRFKPSTAGIASTVWNRQLASCVVCGETMDSTLGTTVCSPACRARRVTLRRQLWYRRKRLADIEKQKAVDAAAKLKRTVKPVVT